MYNIIENVFCQISFMYMCTKLDVLHQIWYKHHQMPSCVLQCGKFEYAPMVLKALWN